MVVARDGDVQAALAPFSVERAEVHRHRGGTGVGGSVSDGQQDNVALVALHGLEVFDEHGFEGTQWVCGILTGEEGLERRVGPPLLVEEILDQALLLGVQRHDAERQAAQVGILQAAHDLGHESLGLDRVRA